MNVLSLVLHIGSVVKELKDIEQTASDLFAGKNIEADAKQLLEDTATLLSSGLITIPGVTIDQIKAAIASIEAAV